MNVVDHDHLGTGPNFVADRGFDLQLVARPQAEFELILGRAGDPAIFGYACDRNEAHTGRLAADVEN
nr:hypothetical protein [uncultured Jannaschia sp.]